ncbi:MAG: hypothetical protein NVSMB52_08440 [Chloroflexota bacterium]
MSKCVLLHEDEPDLASLVTELLEDSGYLVVHVQSVDELLHQAAVRSPCVALVDGNSPSTFDLWHLGHKLRALGVPPLAFTAHASARAQFEADDHGYEGVVSKPFDTEEFVNLVNSICWETTTAAAS